MLYSIIIIIIIIIIIGKVTISFMQGIYTYIPETNHIPKEYNVAAILSLLYHHHLWLCSPARALASSSTRFLITHNDAPQSVELLWKNCQLVAETST
jgi:hypothetical protein